MNKYNRQKGTYGNGDRKDASHRGGKIVGFEDESSNRGRAEKSRLPKKKIEESISLKVQGALQPFFDKKFKPIKLKFRQHLHKDHPEREHFFNNARLVNTFKKLLIKYKKTLPAITRSSKSDEVRTDNRHYIYDKEWNYTIIFVINDTEPEEFTILTAYPDPPRIPGTMTKWEV